MWVLALLSFAVAANAIPLPVHHEHGDNCKHGYAYAVPAQLPVQSAQVGYTYGILHQAPVQQAVTYAVPVIPSFVTQVTKTSSGSSSASSSASQQTKSEFEAAYAARLAEFQAQYAAVAQTSASAADETVFTQKTAHVQPPAMSVATHYTASTSTMYGQTKEQFEAAYAAAKAEFEAAYAAAARVAADAPDYQVGGGAAVVTYATGPVQSSSSGVVINPLTRQEFETIYAMQKAEFEAAYAAAAAAAEAAPDTDSHTAGVTGYSYSAPVVKFASKEEFLVAYNKALAEFEAAYAAAAAAADAAPDGPLQAVAVVAPTYSASMSPVGPVVETHAAVNILTADEFHAIYAQKKAEFEELYAAAAAAAYAAPDDAQTYNAYSGAVATGTASFEYSGAAVDVQTKEEFEATYAATKANFEAAYAAAAAAAELAPDDPEPHVVSYSTGAAVAPASGVVVNPLTKEQFEVIYATKKAEFEAAYAAAAAAAEAAPDVDIYYNADDGSQSAGYSYPAPVVKFATKEEFEVAYANALAEFEAAYALAAAAAAAAPDDPLPVQEVVAVVSPTYYTVMEPAGPVLEAHPSVDIMTKEEFEAIYARTLAEFNAAYAAAAAAAAAAPDDPEPVVDTYQASYVPVQPVPAVVSYTATHAVHIQTKEEFEAAYAAAKASFETAYAAAALAAENAPDDPVQVAVPYSTHTAQYTTSGVVVNPMTKEEFETIYAMKKAEFEAAYAAAAAAAEAAPDTDSHTAAVTGYSYSAPVVKFASKEEFLVAYNKALAEFEVAYAAAAAAADAAPDDPIQAVAVVAPTYSAVMSSDGPRVEAHAAVNILTRAEFEAIYAKTKADFEAKFAAAAAAAESAPDNDIRVSAVHTTYTKTDHYSANAMNFATNVQTKEEFEAAFATAKAEFEAAYATAAAAAEAAVDDSSSSHTAYSATSTKPELSVVVNPLTKAEFEAIYAQTKADFEASFAAAAAASAAASSVHQTSHATHQTYAAAVQTPVVKFATKQEFEAAYATALANFEAAYAAAASAAQAAPDTYHVPSSLEVKAVVAPTFSAVMASDGVMTVETKPAVNIMTREEFESAYAAKKAEFEASFAAVAARDSAKKTSVVQHTQTATGASAHAGYAYAAVPVAWPVTPITYSLQNGVWKSCTCSK